MQKVDGPKKKMGTLSCSVKNRTECPWLLKDKIFLTCLLLFGLFDDGSTNKLGVFIITNKAYYRRCSSQFNCFYSLRNRNCFYSLRNRLVLYGFFSFVSRFVLAFETIAFWNYEKIAISKKKDQKRNNRNVNQFTQTNDGPKKKMGTLFCSVKNRTECP